MTTPYLPTADILNRGIAHVSYERVGIVLIAVMMTVPLGLVPGLFLEYYTTPKLVLALVAAALLLLWAENWWPGVRALWRVSYGRTLFLILLAQLIWIHISTAFSTDLTLSIAGASSWRLGALTHLAILLITAAVAAHEAQHRGFTQWLMLAIEISGGAAALYGILQYSGNDPLIPARLYTYRFTAEFVRPPSTFGHATYFATFLLPVILIAAGSVVRARSPLRRCFHLLILIVAVAALTLTGTRSALGGLLLGGALLAWSEMRRVGGKRVLVYFGIGSLASVAFVSVFVLCPAGESIRIRLTQWAQDSRGGPRLMVWRDALILIREHWLAGVGPEAFAGEFRKIQSDELSRAYPDNYHEHPHNLFIATAATQGTVGLALLVALLSLGLLCGFRCIRRSVPEGGLLLGSLVAMTVSLQFSPLTISSWLYVCVTIALLVVQASDGHTSAVEAVFFRVPTKALLGSGALIAVLAAGLYTAQDALMAATGKRLAEGDLEGARKNYHSAVRIPFPADNLWCSQQMASLARSSVSPRREAALALAKEASTKAEQIGEVKFMGYYQSAVLAIVSNDYDEAQTKLLAAIHAAPGWYRPHAMLAKLPLPRNRQVTNGRALEQTE